MLVSYIICENRVPLKELLEGHERIYLFGIGSAIIWCSSLLLLVLGRVVLRGSGISWVSSLIFLMVLLNRLSQTIFSFCL